MSQEELRTRQVRVNWNRITSDVFFSHCLSTSSSSSIPGVPFCSLSTHFSLRSTKLSIDATLCTSNFNTATEYANSIAELCGNGNSSTLITSPATVLIEDTVLMLSQASVAAITVTGGNQTVGYQDKANMPLLQPPKTCNDTSEEKGSGASDDQQMDCQEKCK